MLMKRPCFLFLLLISAGCLTPRYSSITNPGVDFSHYRTFYCSECLDTMDPTKPRYDNAENRRLIKDAIQEELENRGYIFLEEDPDLLIEFDFIIKEHIDTVVQRTTSYRYWKGFDTDTYNYKVGTLIINMIDTDMEIIVWQGSAESFLDLDPDEFRGNVKKVVKSIYKKYPFKMIQ